MITFTGADSRIYSYAYMSMSIYANASKHRDMLMLNPVATAVATIARIHTGKYKQVVSVYS